MSTEKIEIAKEFINDFCMSEYGSETDFSDLGKISVTYITSEDGEDEIQVYIDLIGCQIIKEINGKKVDFKMFRNMDEMLEELEFLDFDDLICIE